MKFSNITSGFVFVSPDYSSLPTVTDVSNFRPDSEQVRALKFNPQGSGSTPVYDYPDGKVPDDDPISMEIVALRSGKLDKADVDRLKDNILKNAEKDSENALIKKVEKSFLETLGVSTDSKE